MSSAWGRIAEIWARKASGDAGPLQIEDDGRLRVSAIGDVNVDSTSVDTSGLVGKASGGDFDTAQSGATDITCTNLPTYHATLIDSDIVTVVQINNSGEVVETYSRDDMPMSVAGNVITVTGATFAATDVFVIYTNIERYFDSVNLEMVDGQSVDVGAGNAGLGTQRVSLSSDDVVTNSMLAAILAQLATEKPTHTSPNDFTAAFTSSSTITLTGAPSDLVSGEQVVYIVALHADHTYKKYVNGKNCYLDFTAGVITIYDAGTPFVTGDDYRVGLLVQDKAYDAGQGAKKFLEQSPASDWYTGPVSLVTGVDIGAVDDTWVDQGAEIDMTGKNRLMAWNTLTVNDSTGNWIRALIKHTSGGAGEYLMYSGAAYEYELGNADILMGVEFITDGLIASVQLQTKAVDVDTGGGVKATIDIDITKSWV